MLSVPTVFARGDGQEANKIVSCFEAFEQRCLELKTGQSEEFILCATTNLTGMLWKGLAIDVGLRSVLTYKYNVRDYTGATGDDARPDEVVFFDDFLAAKGEHKQETSELYKAIAEQTSKLAAYNHTVWCSCRCTLQRVWLWNSESWTCAQKSTIKLPVML